MSNGQPFNLLRNPPEGGLPVVVSKVRQAVWAGKIGFCAAQPRLIGQVEFWEGGQDPRPDYPKFYNEGGQRIYPGDDSRNPPGADKFCTEKTFIRRKCDRILIAQNCHIDEGVLVIPNNYQWYAPRTGKFVHDYEFPSEGECYVRPWCGPWGDIEEWKTEGYASFLPYTWRMSPGAGDWAADEYDDRHGNPLNIAAKMLWMEGNEPAEWGLDGIPVYRVQYLNNGIVSGNPPYSSFSDIDEAKEYILDPWDVEYYTRENGRPVRHYGPLPYKVIKWAKIQEDATLAGVRGDLQLLGIVQESLGVPTNGDAFDLMVYTIDYHDRTYQWRGAHYDWENGYWEKMWGDHVDRWYRCLARVVKPLPPRQEGGGQV